MEARLAPSPVRAARLLPGVKRQDIESRAVTGGIAAVTGDRVIEGKALIFWDQNDPGKKRDAIDTDQITPTSDCVSESLATLDRRWKEGAFRHRFVA
jgi:hypothetical protein